MRLNSGPLSAIRGAMQSSRNGLSYAGKGRSTVAQKVFWEVLGHFQALSPGFARGRRGKGVTHCFRSAIHIVDSTTIELVASCMDWAKHRRRKAAAKCHMRLALQSFLPRFVLIDTARDAYPKRAREVCAAVQAGEIVVFDRAYVDFPHLYDLLLRGIFWVTRTKENHQFKVLKRRENKNPKILADEEVLAANEGTRQKYPERMRRVRAMVEVDGVEREMEFLTNNMSGAPKAWPTSIAADGRSRCSSSKSSKPSSWPISWVTAPTRCAGRYGARCCATCCCGTRHSSRTGAAVSPGSSRSFAPRSGRIWTWPTCCGAAVGQQAAASGH